MQTRTIRHTETGAVTHTFETYAEAYRFVMREADHNRLWQIVKQDAPATVH